MIFVVRGAGAQFGVGTTVPLYRQSGPVTRPPQATPVESAVVAADGTLTYTTLTADAEYVAAANGKWITFRAQPSRGQAVTVVDLEDVPYQINAPAGYSGHLIEANVGGVQVAHLDEDGVWFPGVSVDINLPFTRVDDLSVDPRSVTDWGPLLNTAIAGGTRHFLFGPFSYPYSTQLDFRDTKGLVLKGVAGLVHPTTLHSGTTALSKLIWKGGAGSGVAILCGGASVGTHGLVISELALLYDSTAYNGTLLRTGPSTDVQCGTAVIERCTIGSSDDASTVFNAVGLLDLRSAVGWKIRDCTLQGADWGIKGYDTDTSSNPDDLIVSGCNMMSFDISAFLNVGANWTIQDNVFEFGGFGGRYMPSAISADHTTTRGDITLNYHRNRHWDFVDNNHIVIKQDAQETWHFSSDDNWFYTCGGIHYQFNGSGTIRISNLRPLRALSDATYPNPLIDLGTTVKDLVEITKCWWFQSAAATPITNQAGHKNVRIETSHMGISEIRGYERLGYENVPATTYAAHAGQTNVTSVEHWGNDVAGIIAVTTSGGGASTAGALVDVTFGTSMSPSPTGGTSPDAAHKIPVVQLTPYDPTGSYCNNDETWACKAYVVATASSQAGFVIATVNAIPAGKRVGWAYRVIQL